MTISITIKIINEQRIDSQTRIAILDDFLKTNNIKINELCMDEKSILHYISCPIILKHALKLNNDHSEWEGFLNEKGESPIFSHVKNISCLEILDDFGFDLHEVNSFDENLLFFAEESLIFEFLLNVHDLEPDIVNIYGDTPLTKALKNGLIDNALMLLERNVNPNPAAIEISNQLLWEILETHNSEVPDNFDKLYIKINAKSFVFDESIFKALCREVLYRINNSNLENSNNNHVLYDLHFYYIQLAMIHNISFEKICLISKESGFKVDLYYDFIKGAKADLQALALTSKVEVELKKCQNEFQVLKILLDDAATIKCLDSIRHLLTFVNQDNYLSIFGNNPFILDFDDEMFCDLLDMPLLSGKHVLELQGCNLLKEATLRQLPPKKLISFISKCDDVFIHTHVICEFTNQDSLPIEDVVELCMDVSYRKNNPDYIDILQAMLSRNSQITCRALELSTPLYFDDMTVFNILKEYLANDSSFQKWYKENAAVRFLYFKDIIEKTNSIHLKFCIGNNMLFALQGYKPDASFYVEICRKLRSHEKVTVFVVFLAIYDILTEEIFNSVKSFITNPIKYFKIEDYTNKGNHSKLENDIIKEHNIFNLLSVAKYLELDYITDFIVEWTKIKLNNTALSSSDDEDNIVELFHEYSEILTDFQKNKYSSLVPFYNIIDDYEELAEDIVTNKNAMKLTPTP